MTEKEYDEQIAPALLDLANKVAAMGGSFVARVGWAPFEAGTTTAGFTDGTDVGQNLTRIAARCNGNLDALVMQCMRHGDVSQTIVGALMAPNRP